MKKIISLALTICLVLGIMSTMTGCFGNPILGKWEAKIDISETITKALKEESKEFSEYLDFDEFNLVMTIELQSNGDYKASIDEDAFEEELEEFKSQLKEGLYDYLEANLAGTGMSVEDALAAQNMTMDDIMDEFDGSVDMDEVTEDFEKSGKYEYDKKAGKLYFSNGESAVSKDDYWKIDLDGDEFKVTDVEGDDDLEEFLPITFTKQ